MRNRLAWVFAPLLLSLAGCPPKEARVIDTLPDPLVRTKKRPPKLAPRPAPVAPPKKSVSVPFGWIPKGGISKRWKVIVVHHSATRAGGAKYFDAIHRGKGWDELGYHFVIGNGTDTADGAIEVGSRWTKQKHGAHCKVPGNYYNEHGIGICLVGNFENTRPTRRQMASLTKLVSFLCEKASIPLDRVTTHGKVTGKTACPGRNFSLSALRKSVRHAGLSVSNENLPTGAGRRNSLGRKELSIYSVQDDPPGPQDHAGKAGHPADLPPQLRGGSYNYADSNPGRIDPSWQSMRPR